MSSDMAIEIENLSKAYQMYQRPTDRLLQAIVPRLLRLTQPVRGLLGPHNKPAQYFTEHWALKSVSFNVKQGSSVAVVGRNGSGKSTLLQLVCGTLTPTTGSIRVTGRVAALLELGSGFNPEFSGRENVYLNASILGMSRQETNARIDDILAFADIGEFIEQPVKTYSTGMAMRLAFAVIVHVDADILIIDEALAVGDAYFQQKCMRWLRQFRETGTILFCGHDTGAVMSLCQSAIWLDKGNVVMEGTAKDVCEAYSAAVTYQAQGLIDQVVRIQKPRARAEPAPAAVGTSDKVPLAPAQLPAPPERADPVVFDMTANSAGFGSGDAEITQVAMTHIDGTPLRWLQGGEDIVITATIAARRDIVSPIAGFIIKDRLGQPLLGDNTFLAYADKALTIASGVEFVARFGFRLPNLASGQYSVTVACASGTLDHHIQHHWMHDALIFDVNSPYRNGVLIAVEMQELRIEQVNQAYDE